jgi:hypothetical protein
MTTTAQPAGNGSTATKKSVPAQREHGLNRLREEECYYLSGLIQEALGEAERLVRKVHNKAFNRTIDSDGTKGTVPLDRAEARQILAEARDCTQVAIDYLYRATDALRDQDDQPF